METAAEAAATPVGDCGDPCFSESAGSLEGTRSLESTRSPGGTRWLDEDERRMWVRLVSLAILLPSSVEAQLKRDAGLSFFEYHVLAMLSEAEGRTRLMSELALRTDASLSRLSHVVTRLEKQGWVRREACPTDGRATNAVLTEAGFEHLRAYAPAHVAEVRRLVFDALEPDDVAALSAGLGKILESIDPDRRRAPGA